MYKIPEYLDISAIEGEAVNQIAFGLNVITIFFSKGFIQIFGFFLFTHKNRKRYYEEIYPIKSDFGLLHILERKITNISVNGSRDVLTITFEGGSILELISAELYESFTITIDDKSVVI